MQILQTNNKGKVAPCNVNQQQPSSDGEKHLDGIETRSCSRFIAQREVHDLSDNERLRIKRKIFVLRRENLDLPSMWTRFMIQLSVLRANDDLVPETLLLRKCSPTLFHCCNSFRHFVSPPFIYPMAGVYDAVIYFKLCRFTSLRFSNKLKHTATIEIYQLTQEHTCS